MVRPGGRQARTQDPTCSSAARGSEDKAWRPPGAAITGGMFGWGPLAGGNRGLGARDEALECKAGWLTAPTGSTALPTSPVLSDAVGPPMRQRSLVPIAAASPRPAGKRGGGETGSATPAEQAARRVGERRAGTRRGKTRPAPRAAEWRRANRAATSGHGSVGAADRRGGLSVAQHRAIPHPVHIPQARRELPRAGRGPRDCARPDRRNATSASRVIGSATGPNS